MQIVYKVLDPKSGLYQEAETQETAEELASEIAWQFYISHTHEKPISKVEILEDGSEIWKTIDDEILRKPISIDDINQSISNNVPEVVILP
jgi:hypothetical protein